MPVIPDGLPPWLAAACFLATLIFVYWNSTRNPQQRPEGTSTVVSAVLADGQAVRDLIAALLLLKASVDLARAVSEKEAAVLEVALADGMRERGLMEEQTRAMNRLANALEQANRIGGG